MKLEIGFGTTPHVVNIPDANIAGILTPNDIPIPVKGAQLVRESLRRPIGARRIAEIVKPGEKVVIITSDVTRPVPSYKIIPLIFEELWQANINPQDVAVVFGLGCHRKQTPEEIKKIVGDEVYQKVCCIDGDANDVVRMGMTKMGTPVDITRIVAEADRRIGVANIEYHYFAGYSGGAKAIMPGVSTRDAIQNNHSGMVLPEARAGRLDGNPVREDIEEAMEHCPLDFIVNVVLDENKEIIHSVAGHHKLAHREGCKFLDKLYLKIIPCGADIVIASQGGAPKDINLYQTQKALDNAKHAVKKGGIIILVGSCKEGLGEDVFEEWMTKSKSPAEMVERIKHDFQLGGHKAAAIGMTLEKADVYLVSDMDKDFVRRIFLKPFTDTQAALDAAFARLGKNASVLVMPYGGSTLPVVQD